MNLEVLEGILQNYLGELSDQSLLPCLLVTECSVVGRFALCFLPPPDCFALVPTQKTFPYSILLDQEAL